MSVSEKNYHPEPYWTEVAERIAAREENNVVAGDDEPYYRYKRKKFLEMLHAIDFDGKKVLEVGSGPGGNLFEILTNHQPAEVRGVDISDKMIALARKNLSKFDVKFSKTDGNILPFEDNTFDIVFSATVLQHNTDDKMWRQMIAEMSRISKKTVVVFEQIEEGIEGDDLCMGRPVVYYADIFGKNGMTLRYSKFINIRVSYFVCGLIRKLLNPSSRQEGEPLNRLSVFLQKITLPITSFLDLVFRSEKDLGQLYFEKKE